MFDKTWTVGIQSNLVPNGGLTKAVHISLPDLPNAEYEIEAHRSAFNSGANSLPAVILEGDLTPAQAADIAFSSAAAPAEFDILLAIPSSGRTICRGFNREIRVVTVFFMGFGGGSVAMDLVQFRIRQVK